MLEIIIIILIGILHKYDIIIKYNSKFFLITIYKIFSLKGLDYCFIPGLKFFFLLNFRTFRLITLKI